jgi:hypothetical protein
LGVGPPASSDLHGSWVSLKFSNLVHCAEPLHRWHRLPTYAEPPFFVNTAIAAQELYVRCRDEAVKVLIYPAATGLQDLILEHATHSVNRAADEGGPSGA